MKVLFLSWNFPPVLGGIEYVVEHLYKGLKKLGHSVSVITSYCDYVEEDSNVYRCKKAGLKSYVVYSFFASFKFCLKERPDVILCGSIVTAPAAFVSSLILRIPYVLLMHGSDILYGGKLYQFCVKFLVRRASRLAANSENTKRLLVAAGCKGSRIDVIYPGVCTELYEEEPPTGCEKIFQQVKGKKIILSVGRLIKRKGVLEFVENVMPELVKRYPDVAYLVVGEDATKSLAHKDRLKDKIQAKIDELKLNNNVFLLGKVSNNDLTKLYYHCDIFTLPCLDIPGDVEGFGIVFSEAALAGAASLATKIGGIPEAVLEDKTGLLVEVEDYPAMIDAAEKLLKDDILRCSLAKAGAQRAKDELSWSVITKEYEASVGASLKSSNKQEKTFNFLFKIFVGILLIVGVLKIAYPLWVNHYGTINADSYTYTTFARSIVEGHFNFSSALWDFIGANSVTGEVHPGIVWNTHILRDGTVACTVACGYPLFLALMFTFGGTWLMLHANLLLLYGSLVACFLCIKNIYKKGINGSIFAGLSTLFVVLLNPNTFNQFSYPWREALFYTLILFGLFAVIKLIKGGKIFWVILAGFLLGYSCSVKEANIVYSLAIGFAVVIEKKFWQRKDKLMVVTLAIISFLVGVAPLLIQNLQGTGNPFVSLQTIRATAEFSKEGYGQGINPGNSYDTICNYIGLYKNLKFFSIPLLVIAAIGVVVASFRSFGGRAIFFCTALHMALYLQWGNADFRHMFFINYFYAFYLIYGLFVIAELSARIVAKKYCYEVVSAFGCLLLIGYVLKADPYELKPAQLNYENMQNLCREIENSIPDHENSIVLVNRLFMEQLGAHTQLNIIRYQDLQRLMNPADIMNYFNAKNIKLYFLDNTDKDPKHKNICDWSLEDYQLLSEFYNLDKIKTIDNKKYKAFKITRKENISLYSLNPWTNKVFSVELDVPKSHVRFLSLDTKGVTNDFAITVNGQKLEESTGNYFVVDDLDLTKTNKAFITCERESGDFIFDDTFAKFVFLDESIEFRYNYKLLPNERKGFLVPITSCKDGVTVIYADLLSVASPSSFKPLKVLFDNKKVVHNLYQTANDLYFFYDKELDKTKSFFAKIAIENRSGRVVKIANIKSLVAQRSKQIEVDGNDIGFISTYTVHPLYSPTNKFSFMNINGSLVDSWKQKEIAGGTACMITSRDVANQKKVSINLENAVLLNYNLIKASLPFVFKPDSIEVATLKNRFYPLETNDTGSFRWTYGKFKFVLPTKDDVTNYKLKIKACDGYMQPGTRKVVINVHGLKKETFFDAEIKEYEFDFHIDNPQTGLVPFEISIPVWCPKDELGVNDARLLGFMFYGLTWTAEQ